VLAGEVAPAGQLKLEIPQRRYRRLSEKETSVTLLGLDDKELLL
jgi:hypothetical protein